MGAGGRRVTALVLAVLSLHALAPGSIRAEPAGTAGWSLCVGPPEPVDSVRYARELLQNRYTLAPHPTVVLPEDPTWRENPLRDPNWAWQLQTLRFAWNLWIAYERTGEWSYRRRLVELVRDWVDDNPPSAPASRFAWMPSATAFRAMVLVCAAEKLPSERWLHDSLVEHGQQLATPASRRAAGNHAINVAMALVSVGCIVDRGDWRNYGSEWIEQVGRGTVDSQGVSNAQAPQYHVLAYERLREALIRMQVCGLRPSAPLRSRTERMPLFIAHATVPDGTLELLGDTHRMRSPEIEATEAQYAATLGARGPRPHRLSAVYNAGFAFGRSGWGKSRPFREEAFWSLRFGPGRRLHGHDDPAAVTYWADGEALLVDSGKFRYTWDAARRWFVSPAAHNTISVDGARFSSRGPTRLVASSMPDDFDFLVVRHGKWSGVVHERSLYFSRRLAYLVVEDRLVADASRTFRQLWHLPYGTRLSGSSSWFVGRRSEAAVRVTELAGRSVLRRTWGWTSVNYGHRGRSPIVQAVATGRRAHYVALISPSVDGRIGLRVVGFRARDAGYELTVQLGEIRERVVVSGSNVTSSVLPGGDWS